MGHAPNVRWILYGASGYTGKLIARQAVGRGLRPVLAGRDPQAIAALAAELGCPHEVFALDDPSQIASRLAGAAAVLNCAGPFSRTARPMVEACLQTGTHYLDITGEIDVLEWMAAQHERARQAGVLLLPAVGFDVVPTDCLAAMLADRLPDANQLQLAFLALSGVSPGTAKTMLEAFPQGGRVRIGGRITPVPLAYKTMRIPFREGPRWAMTIPWGDVATAYHSTGIPNIEVYTGIGRRQITWMRRCRWLVPLFRLPPIRRLAEWWIDRKIKGPSDDELHRGRASFWGRVSDDRGNSVTATMRTPSGYRLTMLTAIAAVEHVLKSNVAAGFSTPSRTLGKEFILTMPDVDLQWGEKESDVASEK